MEQPAKTEDTPTSPTPEKPAIRSIFSNGNGGLSFGRAIGGVVTFLVVATCMFSVGKNTSAGVDIDWTGMGSFMKDSVYLVFASYGTTKAADVVKTIWGK